tara:strand:- start:412 stop:951 length:540 start_codon:yes stop_codon:yes gene_type:complete
MVSRRRFLLAAGGALVGPSAAVASQGTSPYGLPEESEPHVRTFMQWPVNRMVHSDAAFLEDLQTAIADIANTIVEFEPVVMLMAAKFEAAARRKLGTSVEIWHIATDDLWCWDSGPLFVRNAAGTSRSETLISMAGAASKSIRMTAASRAVWRNVSGCRYWATDWSGRPAVSRATDRAH